MTFRITSKEKPIAWPIKVTIPTDGGEYLEYQFTGLFKRLGPQERDLIIEAHKVLVDAESPNEANAITFAKLMDGWSDIQDQDGNPIPFSVESLKMVLGGPDFAPISMAIWTASNEVHAGMPREKN